MNIGRARFRSLKTPLSDSRRAAVAVVDAAIQCQAIRTDVEVSKEMREELIEAVLADPLYTAALFEGSAFQIH